jgi:hypothetical protein
MFQLKVPQALNVQTKGARSLAGDAYAIQPGIFTVESFSVAADYTSLSIGEETELPVAFGLTGECRCEDDTGPPSCRRRNLRGEIDLQLLQLTLR